VAILKVRLIVLAPCYVRSTHAATVARARLLSVLVVMVGEFQCRLHEWAACIIWLELRKHESLHEKAKTQGGDAG